MQVLGTSCKRYRAEASILFLLSLTLLVDSLNGAFLKYGITGGFSAIYKVGLLASLFLYLLVFNKKHFFVSIALLIFFIVWSILRIVLIDGQASFFIVQESIKILLLFVISIAILNFSYLNERGIIILFSIYFLSLVLNVVSSYVGLGDFSYGHYGAKGFFYGGNVISGVIVVIASFLLVKAYKASTIFFIVLFLIFFALAFVMGTKSGILGVFLVALLVVLTSFDARGLLLTLLGAILITILIAIFYNYLQESVVIDRLLYFYREGGISNMLFSGRQIKIFYFLDLFAVSTPAEMMLGFDRTGYDKLRYNRIEFDFADMFLYFGSVVTLIVYSAILALFLYTFKASSTALKTASLIAFLVLFFISNIAGHIIFNGTITPIWGLLIGAGLMRHRANVAIRDFHA